MRLTTAIFLSVCALALVVGVGWGAYSYWEKAQAAEYEVVKRWQVDLRSPLQFSLLAKTKLVDGRLFLKLDTDAYPPYLQKESNGAAMISLDFVDKDGFKVYSKPVVIRDFSKTVDAEGKPITLSFEDDEYMSVATYASLRTLDVRWNLDTAMPVEQIGAGSDQRLLDHCAPRISKAERLKRLAQHGEVRQVRDGAYVVGDRQVTFFTVDNSLLDCR